MDLVSLHMSYKALAGNLPIYKTYRVLHLVYNNCLNNLYKIFK